jgi:hypothetical protein
VWADDGDGFCTVAEDGNGLRVYLPLLPVSGFDGHILLRPIDAKPEPLPRDPDEDEDEEQPPPACTLNTMRAFPRPHDARACAVAAKTIT